MKSKIGILCMLLGAALILGALSLFVMNQRTSRDAELFAEEILPVILDEIPQASQATPTTESESQASWSISDELLVPEDQTMEEVIIDGNGYVGYIIIPDLKLELPVMSNWDMTKLKISPCRYAGSLVTDDLVIMAHNYKSHFGKLSQLTEGSEVCFTDMNGKLWKYRVVAIDILPADAIDEMNAGEYDLTLFTCASNRSNRVTVRCNKE